MTARQDRLRRGVRLALCIAVAALATGCAMCPAACEPECARPDEVIVPPYVERIGETEATIGWETSRRMRGVLELLDGTSVVTCVSGLGKVHHVTISNLAAGVRYGCWLPGCGAVCRTFRTLSRARSHYLFGVLGDNRSDPAAFSRVCRTLAGRGIDFALHSGDVVENGTKRDQWCSQWFGPLEPLASRAPVLVAWGNHEQPQAPDSFVSVYYPGRSPRLGTAYYSFRQGPVLFVMLNAYEPFDPGSPQYDWLARTLASSDDPFIIAACHVAPYTDSYHAQDDQVKELRRAVVPLLLRHQVTAFFTGHDHFYQRSEYEGTTFVVSGGAGAPLYPSQRFYNPFCLATTTAYHYVVCAVSPERIECSVYTGSRGPFDRFTLRPRPARPVQPGAIATFDPPVRDYLDNESFTWAVELRNFSTSFVTGTVVVDAPRGWVIEPGRRQTFFIRRDEPLHLMPCRAWPRRPVPGIHALTVTVCFAETTNVMPCAVEVLGTKPVRMAWDFNKPAASLHWSNAVAASVREGTWRCMSSSNALPVLFGNTRKPFAAGTRDVALYRMRLGGTNITTWSQLTVTVVDDKGMTNGFSQTDAAPVNGQWYTYVYYLGREPEWKGTVVGVQLVPVKHGDVAIELDDVRLSTPPAGAAEPAAQKPKAQPPRLTSGKPHAAKD